MEDKVLVVTHNGVFHADEVMAVALINTFINKNINIKRIPHNKSVEDIFATANEYIKFAVDIGRVYDPDKGLFDHHQFVNSENDKASAGLILAYLLNTDYLDDGLYLKLKSLVRLVDNNDLGIDKCGIWEFPSLIKRLNSKNIYSKEQDEAFLSAVDFTVKIINSIKTGYEDMVSAAKILESGHVYGDILVMDKYPGYIWPEVLLKNKSFDDINIVAWYDSDRNEWKAQNVPSTQGSFAPRNMERRVGYRDTLPEGCVFLHPEGFFGVFNTKEDLLKYLQ